MGDGITVSTWPALSPIPPSSCCRKDKFLAFGCRGPSTALPISSRTRRTDNLARHGAAPGIRSRRSRCRGHFIHIVRPDPAAVRGEQRSNLLGCPSPDRHFIAAAPFSQCGSGRVVLAAAATIVRPVAYGRRAAPFRWRRAASLLLVPVAGSPIPPYHVTDFDAVAGRGVPVTARSTEPGASSPLPRQSDLRLTGTTPPTNGRAL